MFYGSFDEVFFAQYVGLSRFYGYKACNHYILMGTNNRTARI